MYAGPTTFAQGGVLERKDLLETLVGLHEAGRVMGSTLDGAEIGRRMLEILERTLEVTASALHICEGSGGLRVLGSRGPRDSLQTGVSPGRIEAARQRALEAEKRHTLQIDDALVGVFCPCPRAPQQLAY